MKNIMKLAVISTLMAIGIATVNAQTTNTVLRVNVALAGFKQVDESNAAPVRITNKDIISLLNSNGFNFGRSAQLVLISSESGAPTFQVREKGEGTNVITTSINTDNLRVESSETEVEARNGVRYTILTFVFNDGHGTFFNVSGFATLRRGRISGRGIGFLEHRTINAAVQVNGEGAVANAAAVFKGTVSASGPKLEIED